MRIGWLRRRAARHLFTMQKALASVVPGFQAPPKT
jgi:hypothetical protein